MYTDFFNPFRPVMCRLNSIMHKMERLMSATQDVLDIVTGLVAEQDAILTAVQALEAAQGAGNQAAIDSAVAAAVGSIKDAVTNLKAHTDAVQTALTPTPAP